MAKVWEPKPIEVYKAWVNALIDEASEELTSWESNFVDSISNRLADGRNLSELQAEKLENIYSSKTK